MPSKNSKKHISCPLNCLDGSKFSCCITVPITQFCSYFRLANELNLTTTLTDYESYVFRDEAGSDVTEEADELYGEYEGAYTKVEELKNLKEKNKERDITIRKVYYPRFLSI